MIFYYVSLLYYFSIYFSSLVFISYYKFNFVSFFLINLLFAIFFYSYTLQMSPSCASLFLVLPLPALKSWERKNATTVRTIGETQVPFACMLFKELATTTGTSTKTAKKAIGLD